MANIKGSQSGKSYGNEVWIGENNEPLDLRYELKFTPQTIAKNTHSIWRYKSAIPGFDHKEIVTLGEGFTPLMKIKTKSGLKLSVKLDHLFPTGSYKDRGSAVMLSYIRQLGVNNIIQDSSGNAGASVAAYATASGIKCHIFLPENTSEDKILQVRAFGGLITKVPGNRQNTSEAALLAAETTYYASHCYNPYFYQGTKTFAYEILEQNNWQSPESVILPVGNGTLLLGCYIGFTELAQAGIISKIPKLIAIQSDKCNPIYQIFNNPSDLINSTKFSETIAEGIAIPNPVRMNQMVNAIAKTGGTVIEVSDSEIKNAWFEMANLGHYIEPTSASTIAGAEKYAATIENSENIFSLFSGNGLKASDKIAQLVQQKKSELPD